MQAARQSFCLLLALSSVLTECTFGESFAPADFDRDIAPLIAQRCLSCHSGHEPKGKLDLSTRETAMAGGESGPVIDKNDLSNSFLWQQIESDQMPPKKP